VLAVLALVGLLVYGLVQKGSSRVAVGEQVPSTSLPRLEGAGDGSIAQYKGRWVLVNFWASWCGPCKEEAPALEEFQRQHGGSGFTVLGIDTRDLSDDGQAFVQRYGLSYPQLRDGDGGAAHGFGTTGVPENFLVDPKGIVRWETPGPVDEQYLHEQVEPFLPQEKS
jgi:cytochrome c biogenesis protein CcmG/thiol:disulfide interchange protein DsbE